MNLAILITNNNNYDLQMITNNVNKPLLVKQLFQKKVPRSQLHVCPQHLKKIIKHKNKNKQILDRQVPSQIKLRKQLFHLLDPINHSFTMRLTTYNDF